MARATVWLRWLLVAGWVAGAVAATLFLPSFSAAEGSGNTGVLPVHSPAVRTELFAVHAFGFPLLSQDVLVQHRAAGLSDAVQAATVLRAAQIDRQALHGSPPILAALPVLDAGGVFPSSRHPGSTALTFLFFRPGVSTSLQTAVIGTYTRRHLSSPADGYVGATGAYVAEGIQADDVSGSLEPIELAAVGVVFLVVALAFRSLVAPLAALASVGVAYLVSVRVLAEAALRLGFQLPGQLEPLIVILVVGIVADYTIFFLSAQRVALAGGDPPTTAARLAARKVMPLVAVAGVTVAAGTATLSIARLSLYGQLGPGMAIASIVAVAVAVTFVPALMAVVGRRLFWPSRAEPGGGWARRWRRWRTAMVRAGTRRGVAAVVLVVTLGGLAAAAAQAGGIRLGLNLVSDLSPASAPARASRAAAQGFAPGIVAPTVVVVDGRGVGHRGPALSALQRRLSRQPGVAGVLGPADRPGRLRVGLFVTPDAGAVRYLVVLDHDPFGAAAISTVDRLRAVMPALLRASGLPPRFGLTGDTAVAATLTAETGAAVLRVSGAILAVDLVMLVLLLRCLVAPLCLLGGSLLSVLAALGITAAVFPDAYTTGLTFYVPMAVGVLLMSFGSDYNIFLVGRIWEEENAGSLQGAIVAAVPQAASTITRAGTALALTFALLALVPLHSFRTFAFAMVVGVALDTFVVRSLVVPALLALLRHRAGWPNGRLMRDLRPSQPVTPAPPG